MKSELREKVLKTQVRVIAEKAGGSGTLIYSNKNSEGFETYAISCHHVIDNAITVEKEWDSKIGREIKKEKRKKVKVEFFDYESVPHGERPLTNSVDADIVAYDQAHDMALLKLRIIKKIDNIAELCSIDRAKKIDQTDEVWACGSQLLHDPLITDGRVNHMGDEIDHKDYWMSSACIMFGSSGGGVYLKDGCQFIGIPSRIDIAWSPVAHLGYFSPITRVYQFLEEQNFNFIFDSTHTSEQDAKERERILKREQERKERLMPEELDETEKEADKKISDDHLIVIDGDDGYYHFATDTTHDDRSW